jgi:hypothetical protein
VGTPIVATKIVLVNGVFLKVLIFQPFRKPFPPWRWPLKPSGRRQTE